MIWWLTDSRRFGSEKAAVERLAEEGWFSFSRWEIHMGLLTAEGEILARGVRYSVRLVYPDHFPLVPAWVEPQDPEASWSTHRDGKGGLLCLELRPDNWSPTASGAELHP